MLQTQSVYPATLGLLKEISFVVRSLLYFDEADLDPTPILNQKAAWEEVKAKLTETVRNYIDENGLLM